MMAFVVDIFSPHDGSVDLRVLSERFTPTCEEGEEGIVGLSYQYKDEQGNTIHISRGKVKDAKRQFAHQVCAFFLFLPSTPMFSERPDIPISRHRPNPCKTDITKTALNFTQHPSCLPFHPAASCVSNVDHACRCNCVCRCRAIRTLASKCSRQAAYRSPAARMRARATRSFATLLIVSTGS